MLTRRHEERYSSENGVHAFKSIHNGTAEPKFMNGYRSFAHANLLAKILRDPQLREDFKRLPSVTKVVFTTGISLPWMMVGHAYLPDRTNQQERIWARFHEPGPRRAMKGNDRDFNLGFCLTDGTTQSFTSPSEINLDRSFAHFRLSTRDQLRAVLLFYLLEKGHLERIYFGFKFFRDLKNACAQIADSRVETMPVSSKSSTPLSHTPSAADGEISDAEHAIAQSPVEDKSDTEPSYASSECWSPEEGKDDFESEPEPDAGAEYKIPKKRALDDDDDDDDDDLALFQILVKRVRQRIKTTSGSVKHEKKRLKNQLSSLEREFKDVEQLLEEEGAKVVCLDNKNSLLQLANEKVNEDLQDTHQKLDRASWTLKQMNEVEEARGKRLGELDQEMQNLRDWKEKVRRMF